MSLPATVGDLLAKAEDDLTRLTAQLLTADHPPPPLNAWPRFRFDACTAIATTLGPRVARHRVDMAVVHLLHQRGRRSSTVHQAGGSAAQLITIGQTLGAAGDLIAGAQPHAEHAHAIAARMASVIAGTTQVLTMAAGRRGTRMPDLLASMIDTASSAARVIDAHGGLVTGTPLDDLSAEPTTGVHGPAGRLAATALEWRRASVECDPSSEVMKLSAVMSARITLATWQHTNRAISAGLIDPARREPIRARLEAAARAWGDVAKAWRPYFTAAPLPETVRAAAAGLNAELMSATSTSMDQLPDRMKSEMIVASQRALGHVIALAADHAPLVSSLAHSGLLFEPRAGQRVSMAQLRAGHHVTPAAPSAGSELQDRADKARIRTSIALAAPRGAGHGRLHEHVDRQQAAGRTKSRAR